MQAFSGASPHLIPSQTNGSMTSLDMSTETKQTFANMPSTLDESGQQTSAAKPVPTEKDACAKLGRQISSWVQSGSLLFGHLAQARPMAATSGQLL